MFYVYTHADPDTRDILYIGLGQDGRALTNHKRSPAHAEWMRTMWDEYHVPDWVQFLDYFNTRADAARAEQQLIKEHKPKFNLMGISAANAGRGTANHNAKLTDEIVRELRRVHALGQRSLRSLAREYSLSYGVVRGTIRGERWAHV